MTFGGPESLILVDVPEVHAGPGEVRIRVTASSVNPTDTAIPNGSRAEALTKQGPPPYVPGMDVAGVLDEIGPDTETDLEVGDRVMAIVVPRGAVGGYREQLVLPAASVVRSPAKATDAEASTLPMNGLTVRQAFDRLDLAPGQTLAVTGAAGAVGGYAVEQGVAAGLRVIADASPSDEALVRSLGAHDVVPRGDDFAARVREIVPGGVDGAIDGALLHTGVLGAIRDGGALATVRVFVGDTERDITIHGVLVSRYAEEHDKLDDLRQLVDDGKLTLRVARTFPPEQAGEAQRLLAAGGTRGRLVIEW